MKLVCIFYLLQKFLGDNNLSAIPRHQKAQWAMDERGRTMSLGSPPSFLKVLW
jgi:hypothetical protein